MYQLTYDKLVIDEVLGSLTAENVQMIADSAILDKMISVHTAPVNLLSIHIPNLLINGVKTPKILLNKEISAHIVEIRNADIEVRLGRDSGHKKLDFGALLTGEMYRQLLGNYKSIRADSLLIKNARVVLREMDSKRTLCEANGFSICFSGVGIDSVTATGNTDIIFSREISIHCNELNIPTRNNQYKLQAEGLDFNSLTGTLHTDKIHLSPALSETAFAKGERFAKDRFNILIGHMDILHVDRGSLLKQQMIADTIIISGAAFHIFRDKSYPHDSVDRTNDYPQQALMRLSLPIAIKKIIVSDSYIEYKEKNEKSDSSGKVAFFQVRATLTNVTNMPAAIRNNQMMTLQFNASFLNAAPFSARINMRLGDPAGYFNLDASLGKLSVTSLNTLTKPMALAELSDGTINRLQYHLEADKMRAHGTLTFLYDNLSVKLLKKDDEKNKYKTKFLPTLAAGVVLKKSNPQNGKTRSGDIHYERDRYRSIFNLMWKSLFSGIKQIAM